MKKNKDVFTIDKINKNLISDVRLKNLALKLNTSTSYSVDAPKNSIMTYEVICEHNDGFLCEHRLEYILNYIKENFK